MKRFLPACLALLLVSVAWLVPDVPPARLAALQADVVLAESPAEGGPSLAERVLDGPATRVLDAQKNELELVLHGTRLQAPAESGMDVALNEVVRRSIVRGLRQAASDRGASLRVVGEDAPGSDTQGGAVFLVTYEPGTLRIDHEIDDTPGSQVRVVKESWHPPSRLSLLPPLLAIALAIVLRRPLPALVLGVVSGAFLLLRAEGAGASAVPLAARDYVTRFLWPELASLDRLMIVLFVVFMLAMVGVITRNGGVRGVMDRIARVAGSARRTQIATYLMGLAIFFDDYANTILIGSTMRPLSDKHRISREKLSYLIDSTAAPVAGIAVLSTWIAFEVSTFSAQLPAAGLSPDQGYAIFLQTLPYRFYCLLTILFAGLIAFSGRDFGAMKRAERRARATGLLVREGGRPLVSEKSLSLEPKPGIPTRAFAALVPVLAFIFGTILLIAWGGGAFSQPAGELFTIETLTGVLYAGSGFAPLMNGSAIGLALAIAISLALGLSIGETLSAALRVLLGMGGAILILYHAWMIGAVCGELSTATYLTSLVGDHLDPRLLPALLFLISGFIAFATGSSWSTMSILLPIVVGLAYGLGLGAELAETPAASGMMLMILSIGAVLEGAIFGDHCSPISDTTVMSSIAAASDHVDHVRTQMPYAVTTMGLAMVCGYLPCTYLGWSPWIALGVGCAAVLAVIYGLGRRVEDERGAAPR